MHSFGGLYLNDPIYRESKRMGSLLIHLSISFQGEGRERRTFPASGEEDMQFFKKKLQSFKKEGAGRGRCYWWVLLLATKKSSPIG